MSQTSGTKAKAEQPNPQSSTNDIATAMADPAQMKVEPTREHRWLQKFVGDWTYDMEMPAEPGQPAQKMHGTEHVRAIGQIWIQGEGTNPMPDGSPATTQLTLGFDPSKGRFVGSWLGTMMAHLWVYDGELSADGNTLTLKSEGPSFTEANKRANYRDVFEFKNNDTLRTLTASVQGEDGQWTQFMTMDYHRKK
jgi:hypothetical protein